MTEKMQRLKPSFLEAGLPVASLSAESQRDNNARQRPPHNRLHIWWARRPPTVSRAAILAGLLPYDLELDESVLPPLIADPTPADLDNLPRKLQPHRAFFEGLLAETGPTQLTKSHLGFLRAMGITGDASAVYRRLALRDELARNDTRISLPDSLVFRHSPAFTVSPSPALLEDILNSVRESLGLPAAEPIVVLDSVAGGGSIPLEAVRYGMKVYASDLNPVASLVLKATIEYPARFGASLRSTIEREAQTVNEAVRARLAGLFPAEPAAKWWADMELALRTQISGKQLSELGPGGDAATRDFLWARIVPCPACSLNIPLSTNFSIVNDKDKPEAAIAAFPEVPARSVGNDCSFRIVGRAEWDRCMWPRPGFIHWHPTGTPTYKDGSAICPRCGKITDGDDVKEVARAREGGLAAQMYAVCSQVPVRLAYRKGEQKIKYVWRFRAPAPADLAAVAAAEVELARLLPRWEAQDLVPSEEVPEIMEDRRPREYGMTRWRDLFLPRQLLTNMVVLEEIRAAQERVRAELPEAEAEAVSVYLAFMLSKVINYNSVNTFWHAGRNTVTQTFSRHDFAFRPAFCEFEGARETVMWAAAQVIGAYDALARLIHGQPLTAADMLDDEAAGEETEAVDEADDVLASAVESQVGLSAGAFALRQGVIVPTVTCDDAAALTVPSPGSVHLLCLDPPYYNNVQYSELSNFFYVWLKRALRDWPGLAPLFREPLAESNREAVANAAHWQREAERDLAAWKALHDAAFARHRAARLKVAEANARAAEEAGPRPLSARDRADRFYEDKMAAIFRRSRLLLHPGGRMVVMFSHKETKAWRSLGMALIRAGFDIRSSAPVHTEAESSLNIRGLDAARSTILLLCEPRLDADQPVGNWGTVQRRVAAVARGAAERFQDQGLTGTDLYLSALGPALGEVARQWPVTDFAGREVDLQDALETAYAAVGGWRLERLLAGLTEGPDFATVDPGFTAGSVDHDTQILWLWLDTFLGDTASSDDVRKLAKALDVELNEFRRLGMLKVDKEIFELQPPQEVDLRLLSQRLLGKEAARGRAAREADAWEEREFPGFVGAAVWNAIALMAGAEGDARGVEAVRRWLSASGYGAQREFRGAFAVTLRLLEQVFGRRPAGDAWGDTAREARRAWDLAISGWRA